MTKSSDTAPAPNVTTRLRWFRVKCEVVGIGPTWHNLSLVDMENVPPALDGWSIRVRGGGVFFVSPKGWHAHQADKSGTDEETLIEFARSEVRFVWKSNEGAACDKLSRFDVTLKRAPVQSDTAVSIDPKELGDA